jgi:hypothetical protein
MPQKRKIIWESKPMNEFINVLEETLDYKRRRKFDDKFTFKEKLKKLPPELNIIVNQLQQLVDAKATLENGSLFQYSIHKAVYGPNFGNYFIELNFTDCETCIDYIATKGIGHYVLSVNHRSCPEGTLEESAGNADEILVNLAIFLGNTLGSIGMLDKNVYPKKVQDHLGI